MEERKEQNRLVRILSYDVNMPKNKQLFFESIVLMIDSGINIITALEQYRSENKIKSLNEILDGMIKDIRSGQPFWQCLQKYKIIKGNMLDIVRVGEESGNLAQNLNIVLAQVRKDKEIRSKILNASLYPAIVVIVLLIVGTVIAVFVLPRLTEVYKSFNTELPTITQYMIAIGDFMDGSGKIIVPIAVVLFIIILYFVFIFNKTNWIGQKILLRFPVIKTAILQLEMSRFGYLMSSLLDSGFKVVHSLDIISESTSLRAYKKYYKFLADSISSGDTFAQSFDQQQKESKRLIPMYARQALMSGEQTGRLRQAAWQIGETYQKEYDYTTANLYVLLEPILLIVVWIGVFVMAIAVILPIYNLMGNFSSITDSPSDQVDQPQVIEIRKVKLITNGKLSIPVYAERAGSVIRFYAQPDSIYEIRSKDIAWYEIDLKDGTVGWVEQRYCEELPIERITTIVK